MVTLRRQRHRQKTIYAKCSTIHGVCNAAVNNDEGSTGLRADRIGRVVFKDGHESEVVAFIQ